MDEEVVLLEEQLATAHADIERLQVQVADLAARDTQRDAELQELRNELQTSRADAEAATSLLAARAEETQRLQDAISQAESRSHEAVQRYGEAVLQREPTCPPTS